MGYMSLKERLGEVFKPWEIDDLPWGEDIDEIRAPD